MASKRLAMRQARDRSCRRAVCWSADVPRLTSPELEIKRIAARQCGCVCVTIEVASGPAGVIERRHYIAGPHAVGDERERFTGTPDPGWHQLPEWAAQATRTAGPVPARGTGEVGGTA
jgi:hypothetical protein